MNHLHFKLEDPRWAITFAGAAVSAMQEPNSKVNGPFNISLEGDNDLIQYMGSYFSRKPEGIYPYVPPTEDQYTALDYFQAARLAKNLAEQHGIKQDPVVVPLYIHMLSSVALLMTPGIVCEAGYFFPKFSNKELREVDVTGCIIQEEGMRPYAERFLEGAGIKEKSIVSIEGMSDLEIAKMYFRTNAFVARPFHLLHYIARSQYKGYDFLYENIPALAYIDNSVKPTNRFLVSFNGQIPVLDGEPHQMVKKKGELWKLRMQYKFDHREFYRDMARKGR